MKLLPYILLEKYIYILSLQIASPGNQHCASCIGTLSFPVSNDVLRGIQGLYFPNPRRHNISAFSNFCAKGAKISISQSLLYCICSISCRHISVISVSLMLLYRMAQKSDHWLLLYCDSRLLCDMQINTLTYLLTHLRLARVLWLPPRLYF